MDLRVLLKLDGSGFTQGISKVRQQVGHLGNNVFGGLKGQIAGAFSVGAIAMLSKRTLEFAGNMRDLSDRLGVNVEWLQKMNVAAGQVGATAEDVAIFMAKIAQSREDAFNDPTGGSAQRYSRLGFSGADIQNLSPQKFIDKLAQAFGNGVISGQMENDLQDLGGKTARKMITTFVTKMDDASANIIPEGLIDQLDDIGDAFFMLNQQLIVGFAPAIVATVNGVRRVIEAFNDAGVFLGTFFGTLKGPQNLGLTGEDILFGGISKKLKAADQRTIQNVKDAWIASQKRLGEIDAERAERADLRQMSRRDMLTRRKIRENSGPGFQLTEGSAKEAKIPAVKQKQILTDSLLSVGNFLGARRSTIDSIAMETNKLLRGHTRLLERIANNGSQSGLDIQVPGY